MYSLNEMTGIQININYHLGHAYTSLLRIKNIQNSLKIPKLENKTKHAAKGRIVAFTWKTLNKCLEVLFHHRKKSIQHPHYDYNTIPKPRSSDD